MPYLRRPPAQPKPPPLPNALGAMRQDEFDEIPFGRWGGQVLGRGDDPPPPPPVIPPPVCEGEREPEQPERPTAIEEMMADAVERGEREWRRCPARR